MSDTPRTDKATRMAFANEHMVPTEFSQELERELANANADYMALARRLDGHDVNECLLNLNRFKSELAEARKQRDRLVSALQSVMDYRQGKPPYDFHQYRESERDNMAHDAWQVVEQNCLSLLSETSDKSDANAIDD